MSDKCKEKMFGDYRWYQCSNKAKADGYCGVHHPDTKKAKQEKSDAAHKRNMANSPFTKLREAEAKIESLQVELSTYKQWVKDRVTDDICENTLTQNVEAAVASYMAESFPTPPEGGE